MLYIPKEFLESFATSFWEQKKQFAMLVEIWYIIESILHFKMFLKIEHSFNLNLNLKIYWKSNFECMFPIFIIRINLCEKGF